MAVLAGTAGVVGAQEAARIEVVNLVDADAPSHALIRNFALNGGRGLERGYLSGLLALKPGDYTFTSSNPSVDGGEEVSRFSAVPGKYLLLVNHIREHQGRRVLAHSQLELDDSPATRSELVLVSYLPGEETGVVLGDRPVRLTRELPVSVAVEPGTRRIRTAEGRLIVEGEVEVRSRSYVLLSMDRAGQIVGTILRVELRQP